MSDKIKLGPYLRNQIEGRRDMAIEYEAKAANLEQEAAAYRDAAAVARKDADALARGTELEIV